MSGAVEFPYEELKGYDDEEPTTHPDHEMTADDLNAAFLKIFVWLTKAKAHDQRAIKSLGIKVVAAAWVMNPELFGGAPAHMVARSFGVSPQIMKTYTAAFSREFKIQNRFQAHDWQN